MTVQAETHINAFRSVAVDALAAAEKAKADAGQAVQAYVDRGGKAEDVLPALTPEPESEPEPEPEPKLEDESPKKASRGKGTK